MGRFWGEGGRRVARFVEVGLASYLRAGKMAWNWGAIKIRTGEIDLVDYRRIEWMMDIVSGIGKRFELVR